MVLAHEALQLPLQARQSAPHQSRLGRCIRTIGHGPFISVNQMIAVVLKPSQ